MYYLCSEYSKVVPQFITAQLLGLPDICFAALVAYFF